MFKAKNEKHLTKLIQQIVQKRQISQTRGYHDLNLVKNKILTTLEKQKGSVLNWSSFFIQVPKRVLINLPLLIRALDELEFEGWIETNHHALTYLDQQLKPSKKEVTINLDSAIKDLYGDEQINSQKISHSSLNETLGSSVSLKTSKTLNEKQIDVLEKADVFQNLFFQEFFKTYSKEVSGQIPEAKMVGLIEYNQQILTFKLQQNQKLPWSVGLEHQQIEEIIDACLKAHSNSGLMIGLNQRIIKTLTSKVQERIASEGLKTVTNQVVEAYPSLLNFIKL